MGNSEKAAIINILSFKHPHVKSLFQEGLGVSRITRLTASVGTILR
ncbi:MAG: hypothetical protein QXH35_08005 [Nitrososphaerota archaeon]